METRADAPTPAGLPSAGMDREADAFFAALEQTAPDACCACAGWTAHELVAHLVAVAIEVALNLEAYGEGRQVPATRSFEEREAPWRANDAAMVRRALPGALVRMGAALDAVLRQDPDAVVPWTGRQMVVATFVTHLRSELALHRFDLVGDDEVGMLLLSQPELTTHAVSVLGRPLLARGSASHPGLGDAVRLTLAAPGEPDVVVVADATGAHLELADTGSSEPTVTSDPAARLLVIWGRRPGDPRRVRAPGGAAMLGRLQGLLAGY
jgi:hypothetical protein